MLYKKTDIRNQRLILFVGRDEELKLLKQAHQSKNSKLVVLYGRRRIGKSFLIKNFAQKRLSLYFEAIEEKNSKEQRTHFKYQLQKQINNPLLNSAIFKNWNEIFDFLTDYLQKQNKKIIITFDEFPWMAAERSKLVTLIKFYWDQYWKDENVLLILCGSIASFMVRKVLNAKSLYGRVDLQICLREMLPSDCQKILLNKRSINEILQYLIIMGGIPKYLENVNPNRSFEQNINDLFFSANAIFQTEYDKIFYSQFSEAKSYQKIVTALKEWPLSFDEISRKTKIASGGGLKSYLDNLHFAGLISATTPYNRKDNSKLKKYKLIDAYLVFYFKYIRPNIKVISNSHRKNLFIQIVKSSWTSWLGIAFENFCMKNALELAEIMGFGDKVKNYGPYFERGDKNYQVDLIFERTDKVITLCEIKHHSVPLNTKIVSEVSRKCEKIDVPRGYTLEKAIIAPHGVDESVKDTDYFHHIITQNDIFK